MRTQRFVPLLLLLAGWGLRLSCLACQDLWYDEAFTLAVASVDWGTFWQALLSDAVHPPGYYLLLRGWLLLLGESDSGLLAAFGLRLLSAVTGTLAIGLMWKLAAALADRRLAVTAGVLLVLNPFAIWYAREARMYSLLLCLAIGLSWGYWRLLQDPGWRRWLPFTLLTAAAFLIHYFAFLLSLSGFVYLVLRLKKNQRAFRWWVLAQSAAVLPFLPWAWLVATREGRNFGIGWIPAAALVDIPLTISNLALALSQPSSVWTWAGLALVLAACFRGLHCSLMQGRVSTRGIKPSASDVYLYLSAWLLIPMVFAWLLSQRLPIYIDRFFIICLPALLLLVSTVSLCPTRLARGIMAAVLLVTTVAAGRLWFDPSLLKERWQKAANIVSANELPGDVLVMRDFQTSIPFRVYYRGQLELQSVTTNRQSMRIETLTTGHKRMWLVYRQPFEATHRLAGSRASSWQEEMEPALADWLHTHQGELLMETSLPGVYVLLFDLED